MAGNWRQFPNFSKCLLCLSDADSKAIGAIRGTRQEEDSSDPFCPQSGPFAIDAEGQSSDRAGSFWVVAMDNRIQSQESNRLRQSWDRYNAATLDQYLVSGVEDPRINVQSILTRTLLCDALFPGRHTRLIEEELRFGYVMTWLLMQLERGVNKQRLWDAIRHADCAVCPDFILDTFHRLQQADFPYSDYMTAALVNDPESSTLPSNPLDTFQNAWRRELESISHRVYSIFEPGCGSANDFRYVASCGLSRFVRYVGIDIASKNIANASRRFPNVDFRVADLLENRLTSNTFDFSFVHDLFEHLSPGAIQCAIEELLRVTRFEAWLHFFNAANMAEHHIRRIGSYHWNTLSIGKVIGLVERSASRVDVISIAELAQTTFGFSDYYNPNAYTIIATR
jgi:SAM-dependent methyltransferase